MQLANEFKNSKYEEFLNYMFRYYLTENHKYGILYQDHFTDIQNGDWMVPIIRPKASTVA